MGCHDHIDNEDFLNTAYRVLVLYFTVSRSCSLAPTSLRLWNLLPVCRLHMLQQVPTIGRIDFQSPGLSRLPSVIFGLFIRG